MKFKSSASGGFSMAFGACGCLAPEHRSLNQLSNNFCITVSNILIFNLNHIIYKRMMPMLAAS